MEMSNYIESWHNQLEKNYLQRKKNKRLDRLIVILVEDTHTDFMHDTTRMAANIERMNSQTGETRKRMTAAEEINELSLEDIVQKVYIDEEVCYIVKSFTTEVVYDISTEQGTMTACNCIDFQRNRRASKIGCHDSNKRNATVYLRYYLGIDASLRIDTMNETTLIQNTMENNHIEEVTESSNALQSETPSEAGSRTDELLTSITNVCRQALESRIHLAFENNNRLLQIYNERR
ncbi:uncharacterized protein RHIMIDRAFT_246582 [Rhizopus microsporus ATCC 52813]|uniref:SWIM-type domain-containing protein n=1 Tax=Rhizopus microsporus ATCC 52813 TaxID=1340429 RepID=A0A2G4T4Q2_RHIZD|nr:uncharacterized protein RHIMIDRAFT_246582 [Rhizopus microsporus ATCC 52813]PHZ15979.1 hypothetical protein RHIMIDRAFT_246582 [Rhizopus microsporus ATCC 52813]